MIKKQGLKPKFKSIALGGWTCRVIRELMMIVNFSIFI